MAMTRAFLVAATAIAIATCWSPDERVGRSALSSEFVHPDDLEQFREAQRRVLTGQDESAEVRVRVRHADGHWVTLEAHSRPLAAPDGLLVVEPDRELEFLHPLPVEQLWGVGKKTGAKLRARGITLVLEAHAGHATTKGDERNMRPRGSAALMGWPEFGYGLRWNEMGDVDMVAWRGDRDARQPRLGDVEVRGRGGLEDQPLLRHPRRRNDVHDLGGRARDLEVDRGASVEVFQACSVQCLPGHFGSETLGIHPPDCEADPVDRDAVTDPRTFQDPTGTNTNTAEIAHIVDFNDLACFLLHFGADRFHFFIGQCKNGRHGRRVLFAGFLHGFGADAYQPHAIFKTQYAIGH